MEFFSLLFLAKAKKQNLEKSKIKKAFKLFCHWHQKKIYKNNNQSSFDFEKFHFGLNSSRLGVIKFKARLLFLCHSLCELPRKKVKSLTWKSHREVDRDHEMPFERLWRQFFTSIKIKFIAFAFWGSERIKSDSAQAFCRE